MSLDLIAPLMFAGLVVFLLLGYPVAFSLAFTGLAFGLLGIKLGMLQPALLQALPERVLGIMGNSTLLAIPFFTLMGLILERSGMAEELLDTIGQVFGSLPGCVAYALVFAGARPAARLAGGRTRVPLYEPAAGADLPRAGDDLHRRRDPHRGRRHGRDRRVDHGARQAQAQLEPAQAGRRIHRDDDELRDVHPRRL